jgi:OOP family OmpA-OmpF porin
MTSFHSLRLAGLAGLTLTVASSAMAQQANGYYFGGLAAGQAQSKMQEEHTAASVLGAGLSAISTSREDGDLAFKLFVGYQFNPNFALEAGYFNLGRFKFASSTLPTGRLDGEIKVQGLNLDLVGMMPITDRLSGLARIGAQYAHTDDSFSTAGAATVRNANPSDHDTNLKVGLGLQYMLSPSLAMRGEVERYRLSDAVGNHGAANMFSLGLVYAFGRVPEARRAQAAPMMAPTPVQEPVAAAAYVAPPPAVVAPTRRRVSFSADSLFGFDKAIVRTEGKTALDTLSRELQGTQYDVITVEGHTDRLGSDAYNQKLSEMRAKAVKDYLTDADGVPAARITAVGKGESMPVTKPEDCKGNTANAKLVACLQPDRRVVVEVSGTR